MAAAATEIGDRPGTMSISTAFRAMWVAARCTVFGRSARRFPNEYRIEQTSTPPKLTQVGAEPGHKIGGRDEIDGRGQRLQCQLEAPPNLLLADLADGADFLEGTRDALLPARNVQARRSFGVV